MTNNAVQEYLKTIEYLNKKYNIPYYDDIRNYIIIPAPREVWLFDSFFVKLSGLIKQKFNQISKRFYN